MLVWSTLALVLAAQVPDVGATWLEPTSPLHDWPWRRHTAAVVDGTGAAYERKFDDAGRLKSEAWFRIGDETPHEVIEFRFERDGALRSAVRNETSTVGDHTYRVVDRMPDRIHLDVYATMEAKVVDRVTLELDPARRVVGVETKDWRVRLDRGEGGRLDRFRRWSRSERGDSLLYESRFVYGSDGRLIRREAYAPNGALLGIVRYTLDDRGRPVRGTPTRAESRMSTETFEY